MNIPPIILIIGLLWIVGVFCIIMSMVFEKEPSNVISNTEVVNNNFDIDEDDIIVIHDETRYD
jgi:hypothetical protein